MQRKEAIQCDIRNRVVTADNLNETLTYAWNGAKQGDDDLSTPIHNRTKFLPFFDFCLTREDYAKSKPSAEPYLLALQKSGKPAQNTLVIEDSPRGLTAAKAAGLTCWVIPGHHTSELDFPEADRILSSINEIPGLIL